MGKRKVISESEIKLRLPEESEILGRAEKLLGRVNDIVIVSPWDFQADKRGDITYRYKPNQVDWLRSNGHLGRDDLPR